MRIYIINFENVEFGYKEKKLLNYVDVNRKTTVLKYRADIDRKLSLYVALMVRRHGIKHFGLHNKEIQIEKDSLGKPYFAKYNQIHFNVSHTRNAGVCGFAGNEIGVDIESMMDPPFEVMKRIYTPLERSVVESMHGINKCEAFYKIWTRKEAYAKWNGKGIMQKLNTVETLNNDTLCFYTWIDNGYCISACQTEGVVPELIYLSEEVIDNFFLENGQDWYCT